MGREEGVEDCVFRDKPHGERSVRSVRNVRSVRGERGVRGVRGCQGERGCTGCKRCEGAQGVQEPASGVLSVKAAMAMGTRIWKASSSSASSCC